MLTRLVRGWERPNGVFQLRVVFAPWVSDSKSFGLPVPPPLSRLTNSAKPVTELSRPEVIRILTLLAVVNYSL
jgi:hypothetical protein